MIILRLRLKEGGEAYCVRNCWEWCSMCGSCMGVVRPVWVPDLQQTKKDRRCKKEEVRIRNNG